MRRQRERATEMKLVAVVLCVARRRRGMAGAEVNRVKKNYTDGGICTVTSAGKIIAIRTLSTDRTSSHRLTPTSMADYNTTPRASTIQMGRGRGQSTVMYVRQANE